MIKQEIEVAASVTRRHAKQSEACLLYNKKAAPDIARPLNMLFELNFEKVAASVTRRRRAPPKLH